MATQATFYSRFGLIAESGTIPLPAVRREQPDLFRLRPLPNEDVYFYRKVIDNSRVVRQADPQARTRCWRYIVTSCMATLLLIGLLWPSVYGILAGYQIESLKQEQQQLVEKHSELELQEAALVSPERLEELARIQKFIDPAPQQVVYLNPKADGSLALNVPSR
jgi:cell division protein FtsL